MRDRLNMRISAFIRILRSIFKIIYKNNHDLYIKTIA